MAAFPISPFRPLGPELDLSPLRNALAGYQKGTEAAYEGETARGLGKLYAEGKTDEAAKFAFQRGDPELGMRTAQFTAQQQEAKEKLKERAALHYAKIGEMIEAEKDPAKQRLMLDRYKASHPRFSEAHKESGLPPEIADDPVVWARYWKGIAAPYRDALAKRQIEADIAVKIAQAEAAKNKGTVGYTDLKDYVNAAEGYRKEFNAMPVVKNYVDAQSAADRLKSLVDKAKGGQFGSGAGDIAMVFSFIKALDPTSVVQPGEQATARNAPGVTDQLLNTYNRILNGEFLTGKTRDDFIKVIESELTHRKKPAIEQARRFRQIARETKVDPNHVLPRMFGGVDLDGDGEPDTVAPPPPPSFNPPPRAQLPGGGQGQISPNSVRHLQSNPTPDVIRQFEERYGPGSAQQFLMQR